MTMIRMLISIPIIAAVLLFAFVNNELVTFTLWPEIEVTSSFSVIVIALILLGFIFGRISAWFAYLPLRRNLLGLRMQNKKLCKEKQKVCEEVIDLKGNLNTLKNKEISTPNVEAETGRGGIKSAFVKLFKSPKN